MASVQKLVSLRVGLVNVAAPYRGKAFVYRQDELKFEADYYNEFFVAPAAMLSEATARALAAANVFRRTVSPGASDVGDYVLDGFASELYGDSARACEARRGGGDHVLPVAGECARAERDLVARIPAARAGARGDARCVRKSLECRRCRRSSRTSRAISRRPICRSSRIAAAPARPGHQKIGCFAMRSSSGPLRSAGRHGCRPW